MFYFQMTNSRTDIVDISSDSEPVTIPERQRILDPTHPDCRNGWLSESEDEEELSPVTFVAPAAPTTSDLSVDIDTPVPMTPRDPVATEHQDKGKRPVTSDDEVEPPRGKRLRMSRETLDENRGKVIAARVESLVRGWAETERVPSTFEVGESSSTVSDRTVFGETVGRVVSTLALRFYRQEGRMSEMVDETRKMRNTLLVESEHISGLQEGDVLNQSALDQMHHRLGVAESRLHSMRERLEAAELTAAHAQAVAVSADQQIGTLTHILEQTHSLLATQGMLISMLMFGVPPPGPM